MCEFDSHRSDNCPYSSARIERDPPKVGGTGSNPVRDVQAPITQRKECRSSKPKVEGSNPSWGAAVKRFGNLAWLIPKRFRCSIPGPPLKASSSRGKDTALSRL
jgi:hypothetical protein